MAVPMTTRIMAITRLNKTNMCACVKLRISIFLFGSIEWHIRISNVFMLECKIPITYHYTLYCIVLYCVPVWCVLCIYTVTVYTQFVYICFVRCIHAYGRSLLCAAIIVVIYISVSETERLSSVTTKSHKMNWKRAHTKWFGRERERKKTQEENETQTKSRY